MKEVRPGRYIPLSQLITPHSDTGSYKVTSVQMQSLLREGI